MDPNQPYLSHRNIFVYTEGSFYILRAALFRQVYIVMKMPLFHANIAVLFVCCEVRRS